MGTSRDISRRFHYIVSCCLPHRICYLYIDIRVSGVSIFRLQYHNRPYQGTLPRGTKRGSKTTNGPLETVKNRTPRDEDRSVP